MVDSPITPQDIQKLKDVLANEQEARKELSKAKRAGINVKETEERLNESIERAKRLIEVYG